jgi:hypothetical protein
MENKNISRIGVVVDREEWKIFKKLCKLNESDSSKEIRKFIKQYIENNKDKLNKLF